MPEAVDCVCVDAKPSISEYYVDSRAEEWTIKVNCGCESRHVNVSVWPYVDDIYVVRT